MSHIDTLQAYEDMLQAGIDPVKAKAQVKMIDSAFDGIDAVRRAEFDCALLATKWDFEKGFSELKTEFILLRKDFSGLRWIILGMGGVFVIPVIEKILKYIGVF